MNRFFENRNLDTKRVPSDVQRKAREIIEQVDKGISPFRYRAQRLNFNRNVISVFVKNKWRLVADDSSGRVVWKALLSHEKYNSYIKQI